LELKATCIHHGDCLGDEHAAHDESTISARVMTANRAKRAAKCQRADIAHEDFAG